MFANTTYVYLWTPNASDQSQLLNICVILFKVSIYFQGHRHSDTLFLAHLSVHNSYYTFVSLSYFLLSSSQTSSIPGGPPKTSGGFVPLAVVPSIPSPQPPPLPPPSGGLPAFGMAPFAPPPPPPSGAPLETKNIPQPSNPMKSFNWTKMPKVHSFTASSIKY